MKRNEWNDLLETGFYKNQNNIETNSGFSCQYSSKFKFVLILTRKPWIGFRSIMSFQGVLCEESIVRIAELQKRFTDLDSAKRFVYWSENRA
jgi:hypothetical protein